jgi:hypothetical protein
MMTTGAIVAVAVVALVVAGSVVFWYADGGGSPEDFRQRVRDTGLDVEWSNSGPRGGSGSVDTDCGSTDVTIDEIDGELWVQWADKRDTVNPETIDALLSCSR